MVDFTKKAIRASFVKLLNEKPLKQITVRDIVDDCGVNRNTFYYHFQDIPQLLETIIAEDADNIIQKYHQIHSVEDCLNAIIDFSLSNKRAVLHIYRSVNRDIFERYQWQVSRHIVENYFDAILAGRDVSPADREIMMEYVQCLCFGFIMGWLERGMEEDIRYVTHRLCQMKQGELEQMIEFCQSHKENC